MIDPGTGSGRSPVLAGAASVLVPGLGSFYAGHARHGITHLVIHVVAGSYVFANTTACLFSWGGETDCAGGPDEDTLALATLAWLANWGWSVVSAVHDARAFNARR